MTGLKPHRKHTSRAATIAACVLATAASAKTTVLVNAIAPLTSTLYVANADGTGERAFSTGGKVDYDASFSADGRWIVFTSERDGPAHIYRAHPDGTGVERLTDGPAFDDQAALSPDGEHLAFVSTRDGGVASLWVKDLKTGALRNLSAKLPRIEGQVHGVFRPSWSPDGRWIAFSSDRGRHFEPHAIPAPGWEHIHRTGIYIVHADGGGLRMMSDGEETAGSPKWSADGRTLIYYSLPPEETFAARIVGMGVGDLSTKRMDSRLTSVDVASGIRTPVPSYPGLDVSPQYLGQGRIGYLRKGPGFEKGRIAYWDGHRNLEAVPGPAPGDMRNPAWTPDGTRVVYQKYVYGLEQGQPIHGIDPAIQLRFSGEFPTISPQGRVAFTPFPHDTTKGVDVSVYTAAVDGTNLRPFYSPKGGGALMSPAWAPDGRRLIVSKGMLELGKPFRLALVDANGALIRLVTDETLDSAFPSFAPDGKHVVYRVKGNEQGLRIVDVDTSQVRTLTTRNDTFPFWSPDGKSICFTRFTGGTGAFEIVSIRPDGSGERQLTDAPGNDSHCSWTRDSKRIIFSSSRLGFRDEAALYDTGLPQPYSEQFIMNADGSGQRPITDDKWEQGTPAVAP